MGCSHNPVVRLRFCAWTAAGDAVLKACEAAGVKLKVAIVTGDDILPRVEEFRTAGVREMDTGAELPAKIVSMNAYLGGDDTVVWPAALAFAPAFAEIA